VRSISTRLAVWYASAATLTLACLFVVGYQLLQTYLIHGLDLLNSAEFEQIKAHMGTDYMTQSTRVIDERIRETTEFSSVLFYIEIDSPQRGTVFSSRNLQGLAIPDIPASTATMPRSRASGICASRSLYCPIWTSPSPHR